MRVAVVIPRYGLIGGAEGFAYEVTERLAERDTLPIEVWKKKFDAEFLFYQKHYSRKTIQAIRRANIIKALWRIFTLNVTLPFYNNKEASLKKLDKYKLMLTMFRKGKVLLEGDTGNP